MKDRSSIRFRLWIAGLVAALAGGLSLALLRWGAPSSGPDFAIGPPSAPTETRSARPVAGEAKESGAPSRDRPPPARERSTDLNRGPSGSGGIPAAEGAEVHFRGVGAGAYEDPAMRWRTFRRELEPGEDRLAIVGFPNLPTAATRSGLARAGIEILDYVPDRSWIARIRGSTNESATADSMAVFAPFTPAMRIDPAFEMPASGLEVAVYIHPSRGRPAGAVRADADPGRRWDLSVHKRGGRTLLAGRVPVDGLDEFLEAMARHPDVQYIERGHGARLMNQYGTQIIQGGGYTSGTPIHDRGLYGSNQIIAVCDTGLDADSCYFRDPGGTRPPANRLGETNRNPSLRKVIACDFLWGGDNPSDASDWDNQGHGTRVAGHALGSKLSDPVAANAHNGIAPGAKLVAQDAGFTTWDNCADLIGLGCPVTNFYPALEQAVRHGATIHNNSWGDRENYSPHNTYTQPSRELDLVMWSNREFLVVCAAGNDGAVNSVASPSTAKNGLSVAAGRNGANEDQIASFSSRGWTSDGRLKPDLAAPGQSVRSSRSDGTLNSSNCTTSSGSGTSYASPMVAGAAALVRDYFARGYYPSGEAVSTNEWTTVSAALVKAVLIEGAEDMSQASAPPPARDQGWGRVNLSSVLAFTNSAHRLLALDGVRAYAGTPAQPYECWLDVTTTNLPVEVTLAWTDYPSTPGATRHLVNDLDLELVTSNQTYTGNAWAGGQSVAGGGYDRSNNVERIRWWPGSTGMVMVRVWAHQVPVATQDFALVATGGMVPYLPEEDADADGVPDGWERWMVGSTAFSADADTDADGMTAREEYEAGTDPGRSNSHLRAVGKQIGGQAVGISFTPVPGRSYRLVYSDSDVVPASNYVPFANSSTGRYIAGSPGSTGRVTLVDPMNTNSAPPPASGRRFYRLSVEAP